MVKQLIVLVCCYNTVFTDSCYSLHLSHIIIQTNLTWVWNCLTMNASWLFCMLVLHYMQLLHFSCFSCCPSESLSQRLLTHKEKATFQPLQVSYRRPVRARTYCCWITSDYFFSDAPFNDLCCLWIYSSVTHRRTHFFTLFKNYLNRGNISNFHAVEGSLKRSWQSARVYTCHCH